MAGRPTKYTKKLANEIAKRISEGEPLVKICKSKKMPSVVTVYSWLKKDEEFLNIYARAKEEQADTLADEIISIAGDKEIDPQRARLMVDARKWVAAKLKPRKYGDKQEIEHKGDLNANINIRFVDA